MFLKAKTIDVYYNKLDTKSYNFCEKWKNYFGITQAMELCEILIVTIFQRIMLHFVGNNVGKS